MQAGSQEQRVPAAQLRGCFLSLSMGTQRAGGKQPKEIIQVCNCILVWLFYMQLLMSVSIADRAKKLGFVCCPSKRGCGDAFYQCCHAKKFLISPKPSPTFLCPLAFVCWYFKSTNSKMVSSVHFDGDTLIWHCTPVIQPLKLHLDLSQENCKGPGTVKANISKNKIICAENTAVESLIMYLELCIKQYMQHRIHKLCRKKGNLRQKMLKFSELK